MRTGRIKWFNAFQNYGYIILYDGTEIYFHSTALLNSGSAERLDPGTNVSFDLIVTKAGMEAQNIEPMA